MKHLLLSMLPMALAFSSQELAVHPSMVESINAAQTTWKASTEQGRFFANATLSEVQRLLGVKKGGPRLMEKTEYDTNFVAPANFDSSKNWPDCPTILTIRDQSACGSCWALGAAETISDRYCTQKKQPNVSVSASDLMSCCQSCGDGCGGGYPSAAFEFWVSSGLYLESCQPYPFPKCEHHIPAGKYPACPSGEYPTPACSRTCKDGSKPEAFKGTRAYSVSGEAKIQEEIMKNGPIEVAFTVYQDFLTYKSGVYHHVKGSALGGHAVKMIGWGVTPEGTKYWIINNSWNEDWGNNGQFWILRGVDHCGIESEGAAGDA